jgi:hypothetical protein
MAAPGRDFVPRPTGPVPQGLQLNWDAESARRFLLTFRPGLVEAFPQPVYLLPRGNSGEAEDDVDPFHFPPTDQVRYLVKSYKLYTPFNHEAPL